MEEFSIKFKSKFHSGNTKNYFSGLPEDLNNFLSQIDGTMQPFVDELMPGHKFEITIQIKKDGER